jgi:quinoprotein dehydrogenase-associated probable ABC transporter substrate-binding protein
MMRMSTGADLIFARARSTARAVVIWLIMVLSFTAATRAAPTLSPQDKSIKAEQSKTQPTASVRAGRVLKRDFSKEFEELTPGERIAIRAAAKVAYNKKRLANLVVCADPGNMPFSNREREGFENKIAKVLSEATGARVSYYWRPSYERGITRETISTHMCDAMISIPTGYGPLLTTEPIYRSTYVLAYRKDSGIDIDSFDEPDLKKLKIGVFQTSAIRRVLAQHGIFENVSVHVVSHDADINVKSQPWYQVQQVVDGELDIAAVWGPFAGWLKAKGAPIALQPVNLWEDVTPLEYELAIGVRKTDALLKYILEFALEDKKEDIEAILREYGVPLVQCSRCYVPGDLPSHGSYTKVAQPENTGETARESAARLEALHARLAAGSDLEQELSNAIIANDAARVKLLVEEGADVNETDRLGYTPLTSAARQRYSGLVKLLIESGADVNKPDADGVTPLVHAIMRDDAESVKLLLRNGANTEIAGPQGYTPLALAIEERRYETAKVLIEADADVNSRAGEERLTPLIIAAAQTSPAEGAIFLPGSTRPIDVAKALIERGSDVNAKSSDGMTALMIAATNNNSPMIGLLLQSSADPNLENDRGQTALDLADLNGNKEAIQAIKVLSATRPAAAETLRGDS